MKNSKAIWEIFRLCTQDWQHKRGVSVINPYKENLERLLFEKCCIDNNQWHLEDEIRDPNIDPEIALTLKRKIDASNQQRTDIVERIDDFIIAEINNNKLRPDYKLNTESPAWAIDRLSILSLKIYHFGKEVNRAGITPTHKDKCKKKLAVLIEQKNDLITSIDQLFEAIENGTCLVKTYRQFKMYNDKELNPVLRKRYDEVQQNTA